jgi:hypothetical protein
MRVMLYPDDNLDHFCSFFSAVLVMDVQSSAMMKTTEHETFYAMT